MAGGWSGLYPMHVDWDDGPVGVTTPADHVGDSIMTLAAQHRQIIRALMGKALVGAVVHFEVFCLIAAPTAILIAPEGFEPCGG